MSPKVMQSENNLVSTLPQSERESIMGSWNSASIGGGRPGGGMSLATSQQVLNNSSPIYGQAKIPKAQRKIQIKDWQSDMTPRDAWSKARPPPIVREHILTPEETEKLFPKTAFIRSIGAPINISMPKGITIEKKSDTINPNQNVKPNEEEKDKVKKKQGVLSGLLQKTGPYLGLADDIAMPIMRAVSKEASETNGEKFLKLLKQSAEKDPVSLPKSFVAGLDPTGVMPSAMGEKATRHGLHRLTSFAGGVVSGATVIPSLVGGVLGIGRGLGSMPKTPGIKNKLFTLGSKAAKGAISPYQDLYRAYKLKSDMGKVTQGKSINMNKAISNAKKVFSVDSLNQKNTNLLSGVLGEANKGKILKQYAKRFKKPIDEKFTDMASLFGASAAISGASSLLQYNTGKRTGERLREANLSNKQIEAMKK